MKNILTLIQKTDERPGVFGPASRNAPLLLLVSIFWIVGCSTVGKIVSGSKDGGSNGGQAANTSRAEASPAERQLKLDQPRILNYAGLQFTATKAVLSGRVDDMLPIDNTKPEIADITFSVANNLKDAVRIDGGLWQLRLGDGSVYKQVYEDAFQARDTKERKISFRVPLNSQWSGAQITLDEKDKEPASLVLEGPIAPPQYPSNIAVSGSETTTQAPGKLTYAIVKATLDLDGYGKRAALEKRLV